MYARRVGSYTLTFYWIKDVEERLGKTLQEHTIATKILIDNERRILNDMKLAQAIANTPFDLEYIHKNTNYISENNNSPMTINIEVIMRNVWKEFNINSFKKIIAQQEDITFAEFKNTYIYKYLILSKKNVPQIDIDKWCEMNREVCVNRLRTEANTRNIPWINVKAYIEKEEKTTLTESDWETIAKPVVGVVDHGGEFICHCDPNRKFKYPGYIQHCIAKHGMKQS